MGEPLIGGHVHRQRLRHLVVETSERLSAHASTIILAVIAAVLSWTIAGGLINDHYPFFAPIAAVIALNASGGERGARALQLLAGVFIGILCGEAAVFFTAFDTMAMAVAMSLAMMVAVAVGAERIVIGQAASSAILTTIFVTGSNPGPGRLVDALIGAGVALLFSQLLFPARLVALLRRIEEDALNEMARMLDAVGHSLEQDGDDANEQMVNRLGDLSRPMAELSRARESSMSTVRLSTLRWGDTEPVMDEDEIIERLILLGESCLFLARTTTSMGDEERRELAPIVCDMAAVLAILADDLSSRQAREQAVEQALTAARGYGAASPDDDPVTQATHLAVEMVASDIMVFAGIRFEDVEDVLQGEMEDPTIPSPQGEPWLPWLSWRPHWRLRWGRPGRSFKRR
ncbi:aromatic acid exporter family protein [Nocardiopsis alba]|uniref:FUSC family protein n=1 Tax=Nocardiopsis alba TaxID=53437 RepID=UPI0036584814